MRHHHRLLAVVAMVCVSTALLPACYVLDRAAALTPGTVRGEARFSNEGRDNVGVVLANSRLQRTTEGGGSFLIGDLPGGSHALRLQEDDDNDGLIDRGAAVGFVVTDTVAVIDNERVDVVTGVDLGPVNMRGTVTVSGTITDDDGGGLDGLVVLVSRFELDHTAEILVPLVDDDGDGSVSFSLRGVVPGNIEVQAIAVGGRASDARAVVLGDDSDETGVALDVRAVDAVSVNTNVNPALSSARYALVAVDSGPGAPQVAGANVGVDVAVNAGVYDVWFFADATNTPIAFLPKQVARAVDGVSTLIWGHAVRGAASGIDGTENTVPTFSPPAERRVVVTTDNTINASLAPLVYDVSDPDGDDVVVTAVQPANGLLAVNVDSARREVTVLLSTPIDTAALAGARFSRTPIQLALDDGSATPTIVTVGTAILADGVFIGDGSGVDSPMTEQTNWLGGVFAAGNRDVVIEAPTNASGDFEFHNIDLRSSIDLQTGRLSVFSVFAGTADALIFGSGQLLLLGTVDEPAVLNGRVQDCNVQIDGYASFGRGLQIVSVNDASSVTFSPGAPVLHQPENIESVFVQVPFTLPSTATFIADAGAVVHFSADVVLDGNVDFDDAAGMAFGIPGNTIAMTLSGAGFAQGVGTASFAGNVDSLITIATPLSAPTGFKVFDAVTVTTFDIDGAQVGDVQTANVRIDPPAIVRSDVALGATRASGAPCAASGRIEGNITVSCALQLGQLDVDKFALEDGATVRFGDGTLLRTFELQTTGTIDLAGGGVLEILGNDDGLLLDPGTTVTSSAPNAHEVVFIGSVVGEDIVSFNSTAAPVGFDAVRVVAGARWLHRRGDFAMTTLTLEAGASALVDIDTPPPVIAAGSCVGDGAPLGCP